MVLSIFITITVLNILSLAVFYAIHKNTNHVVESCARVIGGSSLRTAPTKTVKVIKLLYGITVISLIGTSYFIFNHPW